MIDRYEIHLVFPDGQLKLIDQYLDPEPAIDAARAVVTGIQRMTHTAVAVLVGYRRDDSTIEVTEEIQIAEHRPRGRGKAKKAAE